MTDAGPFPPVNGVKLRRDIKIGNIADFMKTLYEQEIWCPPNFQSFTKKLTGSADFVANSDAAMIIDVPCLDDMDEDTLFPVDIEEVFAYPDEKEVLVPPHTRLELTGWEIKNEAQDPRKKSEKIN